jgi:hypothetical protein
MTTEREASDWRCGKREKTTNERRKEETNCSFQNSYTGNYDDLLF